jgi:hypothetical protein
MDLNIFLGLSLIICITGWVVQAAFTSYWRDRCLDFEASHRPRPRAIRQVPQPAKATSEDTLRLRRPVRPRHVPDRTATLRPITIKGWPAPTPVGLAICPPN